MNYSLHLIFLYNSFIFKNNKKWDKVAAYKIAKIPSIYDVYEMVKEQKTKKKLIVAHVIYAITLNRIKFFLWDHLHHIISQFDGNNIIIIYVLYSTWIDMFIQKFYEDNIF